ncbi:MAG TPA: CheR family methyltransferase [Ramlibacter sp.]|nr:CheR family methyltransferase [Ramlibacter sp.]
MDDSLPQADENALWAAASRALEAQLGLFFDPGQWPQMRAGLAAAAPRLHCRDARSCAARLLSGPLSDPDRRHLAEHLTIGETYFFRDESCFRNLEHAILPQLVAMRRAQGRRLRLWSAGCSTGEEAYSLAIVLATILPDWRDWDISILATDINARALEKARAGMYADWSFRSDLPKADSSFLIERRGGRREVHPDLRRLVSFECANLAVEHPGEPRGSAMDAILCRNVLIYFEPRRTMSVLDRLGRALAPDGWLMTSAVEVPLVAIDGLERVELPGTIAFRKPGASLCSPPAAARPPLAGAGIAPVLVHEEPAVRVDAPPEPAPSDPLDAAARMHADRGDLLQAAALCEKAIEQDKDNAELTYLLATILLEQGSVQLAEAALRRTLYLCPDHVLAHVALGGIARRAGRSRTSRRHFTKAIGQLSTHTGTDVVGGSGGMSAARLQVVLGELNGGTK